MKDGILLAEDSKDDAYLIQRAFNREGWESELQVVRDGVEAIEYLEGAGRYANRSRFKFPDLLLLDLKMPFGDGFQVLGWVKSKPDLRNLPVVILSDCDFVEEVNKAHRLGAHSYFVKTRDFRDAVKFCLAMYQYSLAVKEHLDAKMPAPVWPSSFGFNPLARNLTEQPCFPRCRGTHLATGK